MTEERYEHLLEKFLEGTISPAEALELQKELAASPDRARDAREQLAFGDLLSQELASQREFSAFWGRLQQAIAQEGSEPVPIASSTPAAASAGRGSMRLRYAFYGAAAAAALLLFFFAAFMRLPRVGPADPKEKGTAIAKSEEVSLKGEVVCTHCILNQTKECGLAVRVNDTMQVYYLENNDISREFHNRQGCCRKPCRVLATGIVQEQPGAGQSLFIAQQLQPQE